CVERPGPHRGPGPFGLMGHVLGTAVRAEAPTQFGEQPSGVRRRAVADHHFDLWYVGYGRVHGRSSPSLTDAGTPPPTPPCTTVRPKRRARLSEPRPPWWRQGPWSAPRVSYVEVPGT